MRDAAILLGMDPWALDLIVVRDGSHTASERSSLARDVARFRLTRVRLGVYVEAGAWTLLGPEERHVVTMRALDAVSPEPVVFSHWSAAVAHGLPFLRAKLDRVHVAGASAAVRGRAGVAGHVHGVGADEITVVHGLLVTTAARTVVDIADAAPFDDGVVVADGALFSGVPRELLEHAVDLAGPRRGIRRVIDVVAFANPGGESANESRSRATMFRLGVEPPELQHEFSDARGFVAVVDTYWESVRAVGEADGAKKYLDPELAPDGAGKVLYDEKRREDRLRALVAALGRWGWTESCSTNLLRVVLARIGVVPLVRRPTLADWAAVARPARPRHPSRVTLSGVSDDAHRRKRH